MPTVDELAAICRSWTPYSLAAFYEWVFAEQKWTLPAHFWPVCLALTDMRIHNFQLIIGPGCGKAVSYDTNILTTEGWISARDIKVGQKVRTPNGGSALIKGRIEQPTSMLYRVCLEDGRSAIVNGQHLWKANVFDVRNGWLVSDIFNTLELREDIQCNRKIYIPAFDSLKSVMLGEYEWYEVTEIREERMGESVCISIDHPDGLFLIDDYIVTHNSQMLSVIFPTWLIGHDPAMTVLGISGGEALMQGFQQAAGRLIESSPAFLASFPNVKPDKSAGWSSERGLFVTGHPPGVPDANYLAAGMNSTYVTGMHAKTLIVDDLHNKENSSTAAQCQKVKETYYNTIIGRADPMGARIIVAGRRWSTEDVYGSLIDSEDFVTLRLPFMREGEKQLYFDVYVPDGMDCVFTDRKVHCGDGEIISV